jgi:hypothetical protein
MEWLAEVDEEMAADQDFYRPDQRDAPVSGRLFLIMANRAALDELLRMWTAYQANPEQPFPRNFNKWRDLFRRLRILRFRDVMWSIFTPAFIDDLFASAGRFGGCMG